MKKNILFILIIVLVLLLIGCRTKSVQYHVAYEGVGFFGFEKLNHTYLMNKCVKSKKELVELCEEYSNGFYDKNSRIYDNDIPKKIRSYDESFFNNNDLIIIVVEKNDSFEYKINDIFIDNSEIVVNLKKVRNHGTFTDEAYGYLFLIELEKKEQVEILLNVKDK